MSKNFELMQQAGTAGGYATTVEVSLSGDNVSGNIRRNGAGLDLSSLAGEECLKLVHRVFLPHSVEGPHIVMFAGIDRGNGCSRTCVGIAKTLAQNVSGSVCLVDANLRSPSLPQYLSVNNHRGLAEALLEEGPIRGFAKQLHPENPWLLSCGGLVSDSPGVLRSARLKTRLQELRSEFNYVLIDVPALNQYSDGIGLGQLTDGVVLILEANSTRRESARKVTESLRNANVPILGAVLNRRTYPIPQLLYQRL